MMMIWDRIILKESAWYLVTTGGYSRNKRSRSNTRGLLLQRENILYVKNSVNITVILIVALATD